MVRKRFIQEQVVTSLKGLGVGGKAEGVCRHRGRCTAAFYRWKDRLADVMMFSVGRLVPAEDEKASLRH